MPNRFVPTIMIGIFLFGFLPACSTQILSLSTTIPVVATDPPTEIQEPTFPPPTNIQEMPSPTPTVKEPTPSPEPFVLPLSDYGPNFIGKRIYSFIDGSREDRKVGIRVWYPAIKPEGFVGTSLEDAEPNTTRAPYPMVLTSTQSAGYFAPHLVSHGFVVVSVNKLESYLNFDSTLIDMPLDFLYALNKAGSNAFEGLEGILDAESAGMMGYSFGGYNSLAVSGARIDPEHYLSQCADPTAIDSAIYPDFIDYQCALADNWNEFEAHAGATLIDSNDGMWQPMTDARIRAVMPMAPEGWLLFGKRGLATVDRPMLFIVGTNDQLYSEGVLIFQNVGTRDRFLISFVGQNHMMIFNPEQVKHMKHFAVAFFGTYLQGRQAYAEYFSKDFVALYPALMWGELSGE
jgi:predicted dienelactone hydrolase